MAHEGEDLVLVRSSPTPWVLLVLVLAGAGAGGYLLYIRLQADDARAAAEATREQQLQRKLDDQAAAASALTTQVTQLQTDKAALAADKDALARDVADKNDQLAKLQGTYDALQDKMKAEIAQGDIHLSQSGGKVRVDLVDKVLFDSGEAQISPRGEEVLQRVGAVLASIDDKQIQVSGHTDDSPISPKLAAQFPTNWELSAARATNVVRFLSEKAGVPGKRLVASGYGPFAPIGTNATASGRARNRRIEILLTPLLEAVPGKGPPAVAAAVVKQPKPTKPAKASAPARTPAPAKVRVARRK